MITKNGQTLSMHLLRSQSGHQDLYSDNLFFVVDQITLSRLFLYRFININDTRKS